MEVLAAYLVIGLVIWVSNLRLQLHWLRMPEVEDMFKNDTKIVKYTSIALAVFAVFIIVLLFWPLHVIAVAFVDEEE